MIRSQDRPPIVVIGFSDEPSPLAPAWPSTHLALVPIGGKSLIVHTIEQLVSAGFRHVRVAGSARQWPVRSRLGDGAEWGIKVRYSDIHGADLCTQTLMEHGECLYLSADHLHVFDPSIFEERPTFIKGDPSERDNTAIYWSLESGSARRANLGAMAGYQCRRPLESVQAYHEVNLEAVTGGIESLTLPGSEVENRVTVDWDSSISLDAAVGRDSLIGKHCQIGAKVTLEERCVLGNGVVIGPNSHLRNVSVLPNTYVGANTRLKDAVIAPYGVFSLNGEFSKVSDPTALGRVRSNNEERTGLPEEGLSVLENAAVMQKQTFFQRIRRRVRRSLVDKDVSQPGATVQLMKKPELNEDVSVAKTKTSGKKVAIVHDWCVVYGGAERVLEHIIDCYPDADVFSLIDHVPEDQRGFLRGKKPKTSFLQSIPFIDRIYRKLLFLLPFAIEQFDLSEYDLVISSTYCVAKGVLTGPNQVHVSYCHSPMRYAWDHYHEYLRESNLERGPLSWFARRVLHRIRNWDVRSSNTVDHFVANSRFVQARINKFYRRSSALVFPPVETELFKLNEDKQAFYVAAGRFVPFKRLDLAVEAFTQMPDKKLIMVGDGPDMAKLATKAGPNIEFVGFQPPEVMNDYLSKAKALIFPSEEDFGILPVEAQACGTPVVAFGSGGALETVKGLDVSGQDTASPTGIFFGRQEADSLIEAVQAFENHYSAFSAADISAHAAEFGPERFKREFREQVVNAMEARSYAPERRSWNSEECGSSPQSPDRSNVAPIRQVS
ncbi:MAG: glycosyltransferase [Pseudomonadota bacterium]